MTILEKAIETYGENRKNRKVQYARTFQSL